MNKEYQGDIPHQINCNRCGILFWTGFHISSGICKKCACGKGFNDEMDENLAKEILSKLKIVSVSTGVLTNECTVLPLPLMPIDKYKDYYGHPKFYKIIEELAKLHSDKNATYATKGNPLGNFKRTAGLSGKLYKDSIKNKPLAVCLSLMAKQIDAVYEIVGESKTNTIETLNDKLRDIAVYSIIAIILNDEGNK